MAQPVSTLVSQIERKSIILYEGVRYRFRYLYRVKGGRFAIEAENLDQGGWSMGSVPDIERFDVIEAPAAT